MKKNNLKFSYSKESIRKKFPSTLFIASLFLIIKAAPNANRDIMLEEMESAIKKLKDVRFNLEKFVSFVKQI